MYVTSLYSKSTSDNVIVAHTRLLDLFRPGDMALADKDFTMYQNSPQGMFFNIPPFLSAKQHFTRQVAELCVEIARSRIHVERAYRE